MPELDDILRGRRFLSKKTVAALLGVHPVSLDRIVKEGKFPRPVKLGARGHCRWPEQAVFDWMDEQYEKANGPRSR